jgi:hypothetical protein
MISHEWHDFTWMTWFHMNDMISHKWHDFTWITSMTAFYWPCNECRRHSRGTYLLPSAWQQSCRRRLRKTYLTPGPPLPPDFTEFPEMSNDPYHEMTWFDMNDIIWLEWPDLTWMTWLELPPSRELAMKAEGTVGAPSCFCHRVILFISVTRV